MQNTTLIQLLNEADKKFQWVETEYNHPSEDVMEMSICLCVKEVLNNYLKVFLLSHNIAPADSGAPAELLRQCISVNQNFSEIDLSPIYCKNINVENHGRYCLTDEKTKECFAVAKKARELVMKETNYSLQAQ